MESYIETLFFLPDFFAFLLANLQVWPEIIVIVRLGGIYNQVQYQLTNLSGQIVKRGNYPSGENFNIYFVQPAGVYFLRITTAEEILGVKKIVML